MPSWKKVIISGSNAQLNSLKITSGSQTTGSINISGSIFQTGSINILSGSIQNPLSITFDTTSSVTSLLAQLNWNQDTKTLEVGTGIGNTKIEIGQQTVYPPVVNKAGVNLIAGTLVQVDPTQIAQGNRIRVVKAVTDGTYPSQYLIGVLAEDIDVNQEGFAAWFGYVPQLDLSALEPVGETWVEGQVLYSNPLIPGGLTNQEPEAPYIDATIASITKINGNNLTLLVIHTLTFNFV
jgi:hypothetical protein